MDEEIKRFFEGRPEIIAVYLYGSRARGRAKETSDVDLAVLLHPQAKVDEFEFKRELVIGLSRVLRKDIHLIILNRAGETFLNQIFKHGKCLYNSNPTVLSEFRTLAFSKIADFAYFKGIMEKGFIRSFMDGDE
jgi:predicted nucleotidyltransferase